jgi:hypothetical protein
MKALLNTAFFSALLLVECADVTKNIDIELYKEIKWVQDK